MMANRTLIANELLELVATFCVSWGPSPYLVAHGWKP